MAKEESSKEWLSAPAEAETCVSSITVAVNSSVWPSDVSWSLLIMLFLCCSPSWMFLTFYMGPFFELTSSCSAYRLLHPTPKGLVTVPSGFLWICIPWEVGASDLCHCSLWTATTPVCLFYLSLIYIQFLHLTDLHFLPTQLFAIKVSEVIKTTICILLNWDLTLRSLCWHKFYPSFRCHWTSVWSVFSSGYDALQGMMYCWALSPPSEKEGKSICLTFTFCSKKFQQAYSLNTKKFCSYYRG